LLGAHDLADGVGNVLKIKRVDQMRPAQLSGASSELRYDHGRLLEFALLLFGADEFKRTEAKAISQ